MKNPSSKKRNDIPTYFPKIKLLWNDIPVNNTISQAFYLHTVHTYLKQTLHEMLIIFSKELLKFIYEED